MNQAMNPLCPLSSQFRLNRFHTQAGLHRLLDPVLRFNVSGMLRSAAAARSFFFQPLRHVELVFASVAARSTVTDGESLELACLFVDATFARVCIRDYFGFNTTKMLSDDGYVLVRSREAFGRYQI